MRGLYFLAGVGVCLLTCGFAPAPAPVVVKPGQVAASKPDKEGYVTMLKPVVTRLHADDPLRLALHWATEAGPIPAHKDNRPFARMATLRSSTITVTDPDGKKKDVRPEPAQREEGANALFYTPTLQFALTRDGLTQEGVALAPWADKAKLDLTKPGVYKVRIKGMISDGKGGGHPFQSEEVVLELGVATIKSQAAVLKAANEYGQKKGLLGPQLEKLPAFLTEDADGNRIVRFRSHSMKWSWLDNWVQVKEDGTVVKHYHRETFNCVARGTLIDTEKGARPIEEVREGDRIWGYDGKKRVLTTVRLVRKGQASTTLLFGQGLRVTREHPLYVGGEWVMAGAVRPNDLLLNTRLQSEKAGAPKEIREAIEVFDLTVDGPHCFFAGGYLVHNKDRPYWPKTDDPWYDLWPQHLEEKKKKD